MVDFNGFGIFFRWRSQRAIEIEQIIAQALELLFYVASLNDPVLRHGWDAPDFTSQEWTVSL